jgi:hypothetical protein
MGLWHCRQRVADAGSGGRFNATVAGYAALAGGAYAVARRPFAFSRCSSLLVLK